MKRLVIGILAHVDSGKTTLSEGLLYTAGMIRRLGRVDHGDAFLDTNTIERERGITIFSKQAIIELENTVFTLLDTPGHVDFSAEMERTLCVLDYAVLVISGAEGVQSHTETLWKLLAHYDVPTFVFVNKMDLPTAEKAAVMQDVQKRLSGSILDFTEEKTVLYENIAMQDSTLLDAYIKTNTLSEAQIRDAVAGRTVFPCFFGSALKMEGVETFLRALESWTAAKMYGTSFGARVFKIAEDEKGKRLTYMKITGGSLHVKDMLEGEGWNQKVSELRLYSGSKYKNCQEARAGEVCAVPGLTETFAGEGLGKEENAESLILEPVLTYSVELPADVDVHTALTALRKLEEEETQLHVLFNTRIQKIDVQVMGDIQLEVLRRVLEERFGLHLSFTHGSIIYKETIQNTVEGVGHYEPLRHYAEVHLLLEPGKRGSGITLQSKCSEDVLDRNWQRLILTHLAEKTHIGVLCGAPLTDVKITLVNGRAHIKHTEGGDFRQATYRAVRQGLMQAENMVLEPWYSFVLTLPPESVGRAMTDLENMHAEFMMPETGTESVVIRGKAPISAMRTYHKDVLAYTHGKGRLSCAYAAYAPCTDAQSVIKRIGYHAENDTDNPADSIFCTHGSGSLVKWNDVFSHMHIPAMQTEKEEVPVHTVRQRRTKVEDAELLRIYENTYGKIKMRTPHVLHTPKTMTVYKGKPVKTGPTYLLIDGYNIIFAWDDFREIAQEDLETARALLIARICNYQAMRKNNVILVFDAYRVKGNQRETERVHGVDIVYTKEAETADAYIEKTSRELVRHYHVRVATSDRLEQIIVFGQGTQRVSAAEFLEEVQSTEKEIRQYIERTT